MPHCLSNRVGITDNISNTVLKVCGNRFACVDTEIFIKKLMENRNSKTENR